MRYLALLLLLTSCDVARTTGPDLSQTQSKPATGSITLIICWDGVCPDTTVVRDTVETWGVRP